MQGYTESCENGYLAYELRDSNIVHAFMFLIDAIEDIAQCFISLKEKVDEDWSQ